MMRRTNAAKAGFSTSRPPPPIAGEVAAVGWFGVKATLTAKPGSGTDPVHGGSVLSSGAGALG
jgi:hypothetical protein